LGRNNKSILKLSHVNEHKVHIHEIVYLMNVSNSHRPLEGPTLVVGMRELGGLGSAIVL
jgi:hypothetical protein